MPDDLIEKLMKAISPEELKKARQIDDLAGQLYEQVEACATQRDKDAVVGLIVLRHLQKHENPADWLAKLIVSAMINPDIREKIKDLRFTAH